jgi:hypothetical protein
VAACKVDGRANVSSFPLIHVCTPFTATSTWIAHWRITSGFRLSVRSPAKLHSRSPLAKLFFLPISSLHTVVDDARLIMPPDRRDTSVPRLFGVRPLAFSKLRGIISILKNQLDKCPRRDQATPHARFHLLTNTAPVTLPIVDRTSTALSASSTMSSRYAPQQILLSMAHGQNRC